MQLNRPCGFKNCRKPATRAFRLPTQDGGGLLAVRCDDHARYFTEILKSDPAPPVELTEKEMAVFSIMGE